MSTRIEADSVGNLEVPAEAYYGVQTLRAKHNFPITGRTVQPEFICNLAKLKKAAAITNYDCGELEEKTANAIVDACEEIINGKLHEEFIVDAIQGGAGTSWNMNANEVIANRANEILGGKKGEYDKVHPNDHVNKAQSTNDIIPTAGKMTVIELLHPLVDELESLYTALVEKAKEFDHILKIGRTQLQDAVPMRLGQSFNAYATMVARNIARIKECEKEMLTINMGATAIGSAINVPSKYLSNIVPNLNKITGYNMVQAKDLFDGTQHIDAFVMVSGAIKTCALGLSKMSNDLRLLSCGPKAGLGEITLPAKQNGSSIMPGKINPVIPEVVTQVAFLIAGNDATISMCTEAGQMELNFCEPVVFYTLFESITALTGAVNTLRENCVKGIVANEERCMQLLNASVGIATALCPYIGYKKAAEIAKESLKTGVSVRDIAMREKLFTEQRLTEVLNPYAMTEPQHE